MLLRALLGLIKGGIVGGAIGFGAWKVGLAGGSPLYLVYGLVGLLTGIVCGKPLWRHETLVTPLLKGVVGLLFAMGVYWLIGKTLPGMKLPLGTALGLPDQPLASLPVVLGPLVGILYGVFVEVDDGEGKPAAAPAKS